MKKSIVNFILLFGFVFTSFGQKISPYIKVAETAENIQQVSKKVIKALKDNSFTVLGSYHPSNKGSLKVIVFTKSSVKHTVVKIKDRGALAAAFKIGLVRKNGKTVISYTNPEYIFRAYLGNQYKIYEGVFNKFGLELKTALSGIGNEFTPFGGSVKTKNLKKYHYKIMMPYFTDPVTLHEFSSFEEGLKIIEDNLKVKKGKTKKVYRILYRSKKVAVFGVALQSKTDGESKFLPKIGSDHIAAMPYEIILQGKKATMLHGKYRLALFWTELSMGTFMKIMSTPGNIEDTLEGVCKK